MAWSFFGMYERLGRLLNLKQMVLQSSVQPGAILMIDLALFGLRKGHEAVPKSPKAKTRNEVSTMKNLTHRLPKLPNRI